jgi:hypothetical protein
MARPRSGGWCSASGAICCSSWRWWASCASISFICCARGHWPLLEISANFYKVVQAMPVTLVGFLIGVLSYLSALQLQLFGADVFIVNILGFGIIRELGPVLVAVLVAGARVGDDGPDRRDAGHRGDRCAYHDGHLALCAPGAAEGGGADAGDAAGDAVGLVDGAVRGMVSANPARPELRFF